MVAYDKAIRYDKNGKELPRRVVGKEWPTKVQNRDAKAGTSLVNKAIGVAKRNPKKAAALAGAATIGPIPTAIAAGGYAAYKNRKKIGRAVKKVYKKGKNFFR